MRSPNYQNVKMRYKLLLSDEGFVENYKVRAKYYSLPKASLLLLLSNNGIRDKAGKPVPLFAPKCLVVLNLIRCGGKKKKRD